MTNYYVDVAKYVVNVDLSIVDNIVSYCGTALHNKDSSTITATDPKELETVKDGFAKKKLELTNEEATAGINRVCEIMNGVRLKSRVTFYYLLAEVTGTTAKLK